MLNEYGIDEVTTEDLYTLDLDELKKDKYVYFNITRPRENLIDTFFLVNYQDCSWLDLYFQI